MKLPFTTIDAHVGAQVRFRRMIANMSQEKLAEQIGVTFQQVQKYEKGANRIGASRLYTIATALDVPIEDLFDGIADGDVETIQPLNDRLDKTGSSQSVMQFVKSSEGLALNVAFNEIESIETRRKLIELIKTIAGQPAEIAPLEKLSA